MTSAAQPTRSDFDVIIVGAGFAGLYALHKFRSAGYRVRVIEAGGGIGGTWYWNRYPGARCDIESMQYSYSFDADIQQEWSWSEIYAGQPEILEYINFVANKLDLRRDIVLNTRVTQMRYEGEGLWVIRTDRDEILHAQFCIMATGPLSVPLEPDIRGLENFEGEIYRTSDWPHNEPDFAGKSVGLFGTGSSGIQSAPHLARRAAHLTVFQRTPNFILPARNRVMDEDYERDWKENYPKRRRKARTLQSFALMCNGDKFGADLSDEELTDIFETQYRRGGLTYSYAVKDFATNQRVNAIAADLVRRKMAERVKDPALAEKLIPKDYPIGSKRPCVDTDYVETFNRDNVSLVDLREEKLEEVGKGSVRTAKRDILLDVLVLATGFDAMTGAMRRIDIRGLGGETVAEKWGRDPRTYLGLALAGFPNMFVINGPGSPSVFTNFVASIEDHINWIFDMIEYVLERGWREARATSEAEQSWFDHVNEVGKKSILSKTTSWYMGANVPGKPRVFLPYAGGYPRYLEHLLAVKDEGYNGFEFSGNSAVQTGFA